MLSTDSEGPRDKGSLPAESAEVGPAAPRDRPSPEVWSGGDTCEYEGEVLRMERVEVVLMLVVESIPCVCLVRRVRTIEVGQVLTVYGYTQHIR